VEEKEWDEEVEPEPVRVEFVYVHSAEPKFHINQVPPVSRLSVRNVEQIWFEKV
jgi:FPC/CPF motif-containing protein YcgG